MIMLKRNIIALTRYSLFVTRTHNSCILFFLKTLEFSKDRSMDDLNEAFLVAKLRRPHKRHLGRFFNPRPQRCGEGVKKKVYKAEI